MNELSLIARAELHGDAVAFRTTTLTRTYRELLARSASVASVLLGTEDDLEEARVAWSSESAKYIVRPSGENARLLGMRRPAAR